MALEEEIVEWAATRPGWQQRVLRDLAIGKSIGSDKIHAIIDELVGGVDTDAPPLSLVDLPGGGTSEERATLTAIKPVEHVNALVDQQELSFASAGLTVVYGDNASGKSGFARLVKKVVLARHQEDVLTDIFADRSTDAPSALISYRIGNSARTDRWPDETTSPALSRIGYYDEACGNQYIATDSAVTYRPSSLVVLDGLIRVCDSMRDALDGQLALNAQRPLPLPLPAEGTQIREFLDNLSATTKQSEIDTVLRIPDDAEDQIAALSGEEGRLRASDPGRERQRLERLASHLGAVEDHVVALETALSDEAADSLLEAKRRASELRAAAEVASQVTFDAEPVSGVGTETWRALWDAARRYSEAEAYPGQQFPVTQGDARCALCQQELSSEAHDRLHRFQSFMSDDTERRAVGAQDALEAGVLRVQSVATDASPVAAAVAAVADYDESLARRCSDAVSALDSRKTALLARTEDPATAVPDLQPGVASELREAARSVIAQASDIDAASVKVRLDELSMQRLELEGRQVAAAARSDIEGEVARLVERTGLENAKRETDTTGVTRKSTELARDYVTALVRDRFTRESHDLKLERVTLRDIGGRKGQLMHRPGFLGASQEAEIPNVLSEGEQTALGLAGFLTEAFFDRSKSAIVLDDPVTSLDHVRRAHVAARLAEFAKDRQVLVFTHDVSFVGDLRKAAERDHVDLAERCVERRGDGAVGYCTEQHPWKAKDAKARLGQLEADLARLKRESGRWDSDTYDKEVADWAGRLSETWERIIHLEIVNQVVDRATTEVRPKMFRMLVCITDADNQDFQESYGRCSTWARRHDKSPDLNYIAPGIDELGNELDLVTDWYTRIRKYRS